MTTHRQNRVSFRELLVVSLDRRLSVRFRGTLSVRAPHEVVQLRRRNESSRNLLRVHRGQTIFERPHEARARRAGVVTVDDGRRNQEVRVGVVDDRSERVDEISVGRSVREESRVVFPRRDEHFSVRVDEFDTVVLLRRRKGATSQEGEQRRGAREGGLTRSGLCEAVTMTPIAFPPRFLLLRAAKRPTRYRTLSRTSALVEGLGRVSWQKLSEQVSIWTERLTSS